MKVVLSTLGKFHSFDLARQLHRHGWLETIYSGYPRFKLKDEGLPEAKVRTFPYLHTPYMANKWRDSCSTWFLRQWEYWDRVALDAFAARTLPEAEVFVGLSGCGLATGLEARRRGMTYVCDRGSTHIQHQNDVLREEHENWGVRFPGIDPLIIEREQAEYAAADLITVPSTFVKQTFTAHGVPPDKVKVLPYGVDLTRFQPVETPAEDGFDLLFVGGVSLRKGVPYLLRAFQRLIHPKKTLTVAGVAEPAVLHRMRVMGLLTDDIRLLGHVPQPRLKHLMSRSHALVLPSMEEGLALVMAQALASGCPVIASRNTGASDLFSDGVEGFIVKPRDPDELSRRMQMLADHPARQRSMREAALRRVQHIGGWDRYGEMAMQLYGAHAVVHS